MFLSPKLCHSRKFLSFPQIFVIPTNFCHSHKFLSFPQIFVIPAKAGIHSLEQKNRFPISIEDKFRGNVPLFTGVKNLPQQALSAICYYK